MPDWLFERTTVIGIAVLGGAFSILASWCKSRGWASEKRIEWLNKAAYACMAASIVLFIGAGFSGVNG